MKEVHMALPMLIYDGACPVCQRARNWLADRVNPYALDFVPCQSDERARRAPQVSPEACMEALHLVMPDGSVYAGAEALPRVLQFIQGWRWLAGLLEAPGFRHLSPLFYRWFARHRYALSGFIRNHAHGERCNAGQGCDR